MKVIKKAKVKLPTLRKLNKVEESECRLMNQVCRVRGEDYWYPNKPCREGGTYTVNNIISWKYIPFTHTAQDIKRVYKTIGHPIRLWRNRPQFLDVGCGIGHVLAIAEAIGFRATGIEYNEKLPQIFRGDIINMDAFLFTNYAQYKVIYMYMPIANSLDMARLLKVINKQISSGTYIIFHQADSTNIPKDWKRFDNISDIYYKV